MCRYDELQSKLLIIIAVSKTQNTIMRKHN